MSTSWKSQVAEGDYRIQFETDDYEKYMVVEKACCAVIDKSTWITGRPSEGYGDRPECCEECSQRDFDVFRGTYCRVTYKEIDNPCADYPDWCPLNEVKEDEKC